MRCFIHPAHEAVGLCKHCLRGLCSACAAEVGDTLACKGRCEAKVAELNQLWSRAADTRRAAALTYRRSGIASLFMGALFICLGAIFQPWNAQGPGMMFGYIFMALGFFISVNGLLGLRTAGRFDLPNKGPADELMTKDRYEHTR
jgi:hypothetical protein